MFPPQSRISNRRNNLGHDLDLPAGYMSLTRTFYSAHDQAFALIPHFLLVQQHLFEEYYYTHRAAFVQDECDKVNYAILITWFRKVSKQPNLIE